MNIEDFDCAEFMYLYLKQNSKIKQEYCYKRQILDISIAEFINNYHYDDFTKWMLSEYSIHID